MKVLGVLFIIFGLFWAIAGFVMYASDIQIGIALSGINMIGIGSIMLYQKEPEQENRSQQSNLEL